MKVLIACEESQEVCKAFRARGHEAYSCDIQEPSGGHPEWHILGDAVPALRGGQIVTMDDKGRYIDAWDLLIAHPPCTYLSNAGARHLWKGHQLQEDRVMKGILGRDLFMRFWWADIPRICVENPVPSKVFCLPEYTQIIQPYQFGHPYSKKTCLWLKNLDPIMPTNIVEPIATWCPSGSYSHSNIEEEIADVFIMLVQLFAIFNPHELVNITKIVWDKLDRLKDNLDKEAAKQEGRKDDTPEC